MLGSVAEGAAALEGRDLPGQWHAVAWGGAVTVAVTAAVTAVVLWVHPRRTNRLARLLLAAVAGVHVLALAGAVVGLGSVAVGRVDEEPALAALWYLLAALVAAAVASTAARTAAGSRPGS